MSAFTSVSAAAAAGREDSRTIVMAAVGEAPRIIAAAKALCAKAVLARDADAEKHALLGPERSIPLAQRGAAFKPHGKAPVSLGDGHKRRETEG